MRRRVLEEVLALQLRSDKKVEEAIDIYEKAWQRWPTTRGTKSTFIFDITRFNILSHFYYYRLSTINIPKTLFNFHPIVLKT